VNTAEGSWLRGKAFGALWQQPKAMRKDKLLCAGYIEANEHGALK
jgi:hypothetical protein